MLSPILVWIATFTPALTIFVELSKNTTVTARYVMGSLSLVLLLVDAFLTVAILGKFVILPETNHMNSGRNLNWPVEMLHPVGGVELCVWVPWCAQAQDESDNVISSFMIFSFWEEF